MLKSALIAFLLTAASAAHAQYATPYPGPGALYSNGTIQGGRSYDDWQQTRQEHGLDYDQNAVESQDSYNPVPNVHHYDERDDEDYNFNHNSYHQ